MGARRTGWLAAVAAVACAAVPGVASAAPRVEQRAATVRGEDGRPLQATIRRTSHGIPHITAADWEDAAFAYGYAIAQDNVCTLADTYVTVRAERSRFFGPDAGYVFRGNGASVNNLNSDFFFQRIIDRRVVEELLAKQPPDGPRPEIREGVAGYVKGYNAYLADTGVDRIPDPRCRGQEWVRPIEEIDAYRRFYQLALLASQGVAIDGIGGAQPPLPGAPQASTDSVRNFRDANPEALREGLLGIGSNAYGLGREATDNGRGMVLGNPHFPWDGAERFYQAHIRIPGKANAAGASLFGVPLILIGHTPSFAWSHTVSTAYRFTPFQETLVPGSQTTYLVDGRPREMRRDRVTVKVRGADGSLSDRSRTLYSTNHGPVFTSILGLPLFPWTPLVAFTMGDANAANFRYLNHFLETNMARSVREFDQILRRNQGIPWVNSIAADSRGEAYYADISVVPNVPDTHSARCNTPVGVAASELLRLPVLDGSRSSCDWREDPDAAQRGIFGPGNLPSLFRTDYVTNSNDSFWLSNPEQPLEGYAEIIGNERTPRALRTRLGLRIVQQRLDGSDGLPGNRFTLRQLQDAVFNNRQYAGELWRDELVALCRANPTILSSEGPVSTAGACDALERWDLRDDVDSRGAILFRRFASRALAAPAGLPVNVLPGLPFDTQFDYVDPVNTPRGLNTDVPSVRLALGDAIQDLRKAGIPFDAPLGEYQTEPRGDVRIPIHGGPGGLGVFNAISAPWVAGRGFPNIVHGTSFVMAAQFVRGRCPVESRSILTYSQSENPESPHFADQTRLYSRKRWVDMRFCSWEVRRDTRSVLELGPRRRAARRRGRR